MHNLQRKVVHQLRMKVFSSDIFQKIVLLERDSKIVRPFLRVQQGF